MAIDRTAYCIETSATSGLIEQGFRSRIGACTVNAGEFRVALSAGKHFSAGRSRSQKCGVSSQNSIPSRPARETKLEDLRAGVLVEEHAGYGERDHNRPI